MGVLRFAAVTALTAWTGLILGRGRFWEAHADELYEPPRAFTEAARVHAVVPARNEQAVLAMTLPTLLAQRGSSGLNVTLVNDHSEDATADIAHEVARKHRAGARLSVVHAGARPEGWSGKVWALHEGVSAALAANGAPDYWLFTDADIAHDPESIAALVATAIARRRDLVSLMVALRCENACERLLIPAFVFFFRKLFPFRLVNDDSDLTAAAAGGCILISHEALTNIGGLQRIAGAIIDDCSLAAAVKRAGGRLWLGHSTRVRSIRPYHSLGEIWQMVARSAYAQLGYSRANLAGTIAGMALLYAVPPLATFAGAIRRDRTTFAAGAGAWAIMTLAYAPTLRLYRRPSRSGLFLPLAAALYAAMTIDSARRHESGLGNAWKGRALNGKSPAPSSTVAPQGRGERPV